MTLGNGGVTILTPSGTSTGGLVNFGSSLGVVLGFMVESNYRRALVLSNGDLTTFIRNPIAAGLLATALIVLAASLMRQAKSRGVAR